MRKSWAVQVERLFGECVDCGVRVGSFAKPRPPKRCDSCRVGRRRVISAVFKPFWCWVFCPAMHLRTVTRLARHGFRDSQERRVLVYRWVLAQSSERLIMSGAE